MPELKRKFCLAKGKDLYLGYINFNELRQKTVTPDELWEKITEFAGYNEIEAEKFGEITAPQAEIRKRKPRFRRGANEVRIPYRLASVSLMHADDGLDGG